MQCSYDYVFFFFSSRRRHTRLQGDWSSDVCSSDLERQARAAFDELRHRAAVAALGGRPARVLLLAAAAAREQPTLNPIAARYADAGLAVRRVTGDAAAIERALEIGRAHV